MTNESGYIPGVKWTDVSVALPPCGGKYFTIKQLQENTGALTKGAICVDPTEVWDGEAWYENDERTWKVIYWAEPVLLNIPEVLAGRARIGCI